MNNTIPNIIHQIWIGDDDAPAAVYRPHWIASWRKLNPAWLYQLWNAAPLLALAERHYSELSPILTDGETPNVVKADFARLMLLHHFGGVYCDLDAQCLRPLDALTRGRQFIAGEVAPDYVANSFLASAPRHGLAREMLETCVGNWRARGNQVGRIESFAGPEAVGPLALRHPDAFVAPPVVLHPLSWLKGEAAYYGSIPERLLASASSEDFPESYAVEFFLHHW